MDAKIASAGSGSSSGTTAPTTLSTSAGTVDTRNLIHLTGEQLVSQYPTRYTNGMTGGITGYQYLVWSGNYSASTLPSGYTTIGTSSKPNVTWAIANKEKGLLGRLAGGDSNQSHNFLRFFNSEGSVQQINDDKTTNEYYAGSADNALGKSVFTLAPLVS